MIEKKCLADEKKVKQCLNICTSKPLSFLILYAKKNCTDKAFD